MKYGWSLHTSKIILNPAYCRNSQPLRPPARVPRPSHRSVRPMSDSFATRARLDVNGKSYTYASLPQLGVKFDIVRLPYSMKVLLENLLRHEDGGATVGTEHIEAQATGGPTGGTEPANASMPD